MVGHRCYDCQMGFIAKSQDEAVEEAEEQKQLVVDDCEAELVYARHCPYCGGKSIEAR